MVGDGEAETGPLAASWLSNKFLNPARDGAVLPILHLNGYKIANPTVLARLSLQELTNLLEGYGHQVYFVEGEDPALMHQRIAANLDAALARLQRQARTKGFTERPRWPAIVLRTPKGWTGPKVVDGVQIEGTFRSHQVPLSKLAAKPGHLKLLQEWMRSYRREELFGDGGKLRPELAALAPRGERRMGANAHANGGALLRDLKMPDFRDFAVAVPTLGTAKAEATRVMGQFLKEAMRRNADQHNFRVMGPDETASKRLGVLFGVTDWVSTAQILPTNDHLSLRRPGDGGAQ